MVDIMDKTYLLRRPRPLSSTRATLSFGTFFVTMHAVVLGLDKASINIMPFLPNADNLRRDLNNKSRLRN